MRAVGKQRDGTQELCYLGLGFAVTKDRQPEGCLGDEYVTADEFERDAGRIRDILVIARGHDSQPVCLDGDLRRTKYVAGGVECHPCAPERNGLAVADRLRRGGEVRAIAQEHEIERFLGGEHRAMASARMVGVAMCDHSLVHRLRGIDMETADFAVHAGGRRQEDIFGPHWLEIWCKWRNDRWRLLVRQSARSVGTKPQRCVRKEAA